MSRCIIRKVFPASLQTRPSLGSVKCPSRRPITHLASDRAIGGAVFGGSVLGILVYAWLIIYEPDITIRVTAFLGVGLILGILAWIGYTMATTPAPEPITDIPEPATKAGTPDMAAGKKEAP